ncbi:MAG: hypothetical protein PHI72_01630 [Atribacterota bacterium]|jgi:hypothetical protein|nr:hypothetical protein [Atribacterota bacterium]MDD4895343.1 hypothetical protein [Atribacterota bacterium]MDD5637480.1 hypothetical protein [Atribacterota bacterium]
MNYFEVRTRIKANIEILQKIRAEQKSIYALEHMLGYHINELEELRPHKRNIEFMAQSNYDEQPDLVDLCHWLERVSNIETSIKKNEKIIIRLYDRLYVQIIFKILEGEALSPIDIFFYHSKKYIEKIRLGEMTFQKLVENYNWETERFNDLD